MQASYSRGRDTHLHGTRSGRSLGSRWDLKLSEGESIDLVAIDDLLLQGGTLSEQDMEGALDRALAIAEEEAGLAVDLGKALDDLREKPRDPGGEGR